MAKDTLPRNHLRRLHYLPDRAVLTELIAQAAIPPSIRAQISHWAEALVTDLRRDGRPGLMEVFLEE